MENKLLQLKEAELCATEIIVKISATAIAVARCEIEDVRLSRITRVR